MLVDRCAGTAQLKKLGFCRAKTRSRTFRMTLSKIKAPQVPTTMIHYSFLIILYYSRLSCLLTARRRPSL